MKKRIAILGSTGSIGTQALEVIANHPDKFEVEVLTALNNADLLIEQSMRFSPNVVVIGNDDHYKRVKEALVHYPIQVYCGEDAIAQVVGFEAVDMVLTAMVGFSGLRPTIEAIRSGKDIALANKETMVVAGELIMKEAAEKRVTIIPVDSEHSAIFQCLSGEGINEIEKLILTASGGPFRGRDLKYLKTVTTEQALLHPNWCMGPKITIDSATLMNKGFEVIEARWLFGVDPSKIEVISLTSVNKEFKEKIDISFQATTYSYCFSCQNCSTVCPVVGNYENPQEALGLLPHQIMRSVGLSLKDLAFGSKMLWDCVTCYQCQEHCPQGVKVTDILYELKNLAIKESFNNE
ncbi:MAG: 4Fe-4S dicluster domain-containing protein [Deltaproteobacteria bacterium]|nr:4Fe-4S dicluster domain-containing protein [Deltaproteobacteria bacterium]